MTTEQCWQLTWETGPDAGGCWSAESGRHVVGRATQADVRCDDPALEPFHVQLDLDGDAPVVRQLAGRLPVRVVDAEPSARLGPWRVQLGHSTLLIRRADRPGTTDDRSPDGPVIRVARHLTTWSPEPVRVDDDPSPPTAPTGGLVPAVAALAATVVMALVVRQMMYVVVGAVGTVVAASTWITARIGHRRACRASRASVAAGRARTVDALREQRAAWADHVRQTVPTLRDALAAMVRPGGLWQRRIGDGDGCRVSLGIGAVAWQPIAVGRAEVVGLHGLASEGGAVRADVVNDLPVATDLGPGTRLAISGPHAIAVADALLLQLAALTGPADWQLVVVAASADQWHWTRHLPHARDALGRHLLVDEAGLLDLVRGGGLAGRHTVVVTDQAEMLTVRTSALRRLESAHESLALVVVHSGPVPALTRSTVVTMSDGRARFVADLADEPTPIELRVSGSPARSAERWARQLSDRRDPEDERLNGLDIPAIVGLGELLSDGGIDVADPASIALAWHTAGHDPAPRAPIGRARDGVVEIDLVRDGPHALLAGTTGAGKSELLRSLVVGLSTRLGPHHLTFVLVDYKGGAAFDDLASLPHVVGMVTDLDEHLAERALRSLRAELTVREQMLRDHGVNDLTSLREKAGAPVVPRVLVVVDEFAALATEQAEFLHALVGIAQRGRSLGVHLLLATQRPSGVISDDIRANTNLRMALRLHDTADAMDVVGDPAPATLPRTLPGRAVMRLGPDELVTFQTAHATDVAGIVAAVRAAAHLAAADRPRRVWCDPLAERIEHGQLVRLAAGVPHAVGVMDLPDQQTQAPFCWRLADGSVAVVGSPGSGVTSTLVTLATHALDQPGEVFVVDAGGDLQWDSVAAHPRCAGVVRLHERERLWRLLHRVAHQGSDVAERAGSASAGSIVLVVDGLGALRHELDAIERATELELLDRIVGSGQTVLLIGADRVAAVPPPVASRCAVRLVLHLHDRHDAAALGVASADVPPRIAGRATIGGTGTAVQLVAPRAVRGTGGRRRRALRIETLPADVCAADLPAAAHLEGTWRVPIGIGFQHLQVISLDIADGEHVLVAGAARAGRSTAVAHLCLAWMVSHPLGHLVVVAGRRSPLPGWLADTPNVAATRSPVEVHDRVEPALVAVDAAIAAGRQVMLAVDDAELVDEPSGHLAAMVAARTSGLLVVAAGRPDALRQSYGHWTVAVRRSRLGLLSSGAQDVDADLLGATLPRRALLSARPGLMYLVDGGTLELVQLARPDTQPGARIGWVSDRVS